MHLKAWITLSTEKSLDRKFNLFISWLGKEQWKESFFNFFFLQPYSFKNIRTASPFLFFFFSFCFFLLFLCCFFSHFLFLFSPFLLCSFKNRSDSFLYSFRFVSSFFFRAASFRFFFFPFVFLFFFFFLFLFFPFLFFSFSFFSLLYFTFHPFLFFLSFLLFLFFLSFLLPLFISFVPLFCYYFWFLFFSSASFIYPPPPPPILKVQFKQKLNTCFCTNFQSSKWNT